MKRIINIVLAFSLLLTFVPLSGQAASEVYQTLNVEYSDSFGNIETLNVAIKGNCVYVDAYQLGMRLGYDVQLTKNGNGVSIYSDGEGNTPFLLAVFYFDSTQVEYLLYTQIFDYEAPAKSFLNGNGAWIPLKYALAALNSSMMIIDDVVTISMPQTTLMQTMRIIDRNYLDIMFDYYSDMSFDESDLLIKSGSSRVVNLFNGILTFEGES